MYCVLVNIFVFIILVSNVYSDVGGDRAEGDVELPSDRGMIKGLISELSTLKYAPYMPTPFYAWVNLICLNLPVNCSRFMPNLKQYF